MPVRRLSAREREIVRLISEGLTHPDAISQQMGISRWSVRDKIRRLCREYDCPLKELPAKVGVRESEEAAETRRKVAADGIKKERERRGWA